MKQIILFQEKPINYAYGYVAAADMSLDRQIDSFLAFDVKERPIFTDKTTGKTGERTNYKRLLETLKRGDLLVVASLDRLGNNYDAIPEEWRHVTKDIGADILVLDMPLPDTRTNEHNLTDKLISNVVLQIRNKASFFKTKRRVILDARLKFIIKI